MEKYNIKLCDVKGGEYELGCQKLWLNHRYDVMFVDEWINPRL